MSPTKPANQSGLRVPAVLRQALSQYSCQLSAAGMWRQTHLCMQVSCCSYNALSQHQSGLVAAAALVSVQLHVILPNQMLFTGCTQASQQSRVLTYPTQQQNVQCLCQRDEAAKPEGVIPMSNRLKSAEAISMHHEGPYHSPVYKLGIVRVLSLGCTM